MRQRIPETNEGIQGGFDTADYDVFMKHMRDLGWLETGQIITAGICAGEALEIGPGPGYLGLEWLKRCTDAALTGLEISPNMIRIAKKNAQDYGLSSRVHYVEGNAMKMPFADGQFDAVFSNGSLHEWEDPLRVFGEVYRVLRPDGRYFISDLRRDISLPARVFMRLGTKPVSMKKGLKGSIDAAYTESELVKMLSDLAFREVSVKANAFGLWTCGMK